MQQALLEPVELAVEPLMDEKHTSKRQQCRIAYLTSEYPKVSHTFIRREIHQLEELGRDITRLSIRPPSGPLVDPADQLEATKTHFCLSQSKVSLVANAAMSALRSPFKAISAARTALKLSQKSERGHFKHCAYFAEAAHLAKRLKGENIKHVHVHFGTNAAAVALLMKKIAGITYSMTIHGPGEFDAPIGLSLGEKVAESAFTLAISHFGRAQLSRWVAQQHWDKIHVIRCTVHPDYLKPQAELDPKSNQLICVGRLTAQKGQVLLIDAFAKAIASGRKATLVFAGDGELRPLIEQRVKQHGLGSLVKITGWLSESQVRDEIRRSVAMVLPSCAEGLPVALMEAQAMGRAVITTFTAGIPELVLDTKTGWLVPAGDVESLTTAIQKLLDATPEQLLAMAPIAQDRVRRNHNPVIEGEKLEALFARYVD